MHHRIIVFIFVDNVNFLFCQRLKFKYVIFFRIVTSLDKRSRKVFCNIWGSGIESSPFSHPEWSSKRWRGPNTWTRIGILPRSSMRLNLLRLHRCLVGHRLGNSWRKCYIRSTLWPMLANHWPRTISCLRYCFIFIWDWHRWILRKDEASLLTSI